MAELVEITALTNNRGFITDTVTVGRNVQWFAKCLVESMFITQEDAQVILSTRGATPTEQANRLLDRVLATIRKPDSDHGRRGLFYDFVNIFGHDPAYQDLVKKVMDGGKLGHKMFVRDHFCSLCG